MPCPVGGAVGCLQLDVGVEVFEWSADRRLEVAGRGEHEADRVVGEAVDFEGEVFGSAPEPLVPAHADRSRDAFEGFLDVVGVGEVVATEPELPTIHCAHAATPVAQPVGGDEEHEDEAAGQADLSDAKRDRSDALGVLNGARSRTVLWARPADRMPHLQLAPGVRPVARRCVEPERRQRGQPHEWDRKQARPWRPHLVAPGLETYVSSSAAVPSRDAHISAVRASAWMAIACLRACMYAPPPRASAANSIGVWGASAVNPRPPYAPTVTPTSGRVDDQQHRQGGVEERPGRGIDARDDGCRDQSESSHPSVVRGDAQSLTGGAGDPAEVEAQQVTRVVTEAARDHDACARDGD